VDDGALRLERLAHELEHGSAALEELDEAHRRLDLLGPRTADESGGAADEDLGPRLGADLEQRLADEREKHALARRELRRLESSPNRTRAEPLADDRLLEVLAGPGHEARVDGVIEVEDLLGDASRGGDDDDHDARRLQRQHLDVADRGGLERRGRNERE
jgi:hypothetical protein